MSDILQAARSYYGLADAKVRKAEWFTDEGKTILCFEIVAEGEDFIGIVERMKRLQEEQPNNAPLIRSLGEQDAYGNPLPPRKVAHIDAPETEDCGLRMVWVDNQDIVEYQKAMASEYNEVTAQWLVQECMLTEEQKQRAVEVRP